MPPLRVYALCESERVAETLAIWLERDYDYRWLPSPAAAEDVGARPALLIDARGTPGRSVAPLRRWPGVQMLRVHPRDGLDPAATRRAVADALRAATADTALETTLRICCDALAAEMKPRLLATRCLLTVARNDAGCSPAAWRTLLREQLVALTESYDHLVVGESHGRSAR